MSGSRLTRKVTVEGSKKITDTSAPRKSVFDRLGPGALESRSQSRRDDYSEPVVEKCRYWLKEERCPFGNKCRYDHGSIEAKSKLKIIRSIVRFPGPVCGETCGEERPRQSKNEEPGEKKGTMRTKRVHSPEDEPSDQSPRKSTKRTKTESIKVTKESLREDSKAFREHRKEQEEPKFVEKRKEATVRRSTSSSAWNLQDNSESDDGNDGKQLDWEVRGAIRAREVALEERRNDLRREIAKIDQHDKPVVKIVNMPLGDDCSPPFQEEELKPEKKKKSKSDKSKKKLKKKSHKGETHRIDSFLMEGDYSVKPKKTKSSGGKKKKKHSNDSDRELMPADIPYGKGSFSNEVFQHEFHETKKRNEAFHSPVQVEQTSKGRHSNEQRREKNPDTFEGEAHHFDKRSRSPQTQSEARPAAFEREPRHPQFQREEQYERESRQTQLDRETRQLEREEREFERERERQAQLEKESRQFERESQHLERESRKAQYERDSRQAHAEREARQFEKANRQTQFERDSRPPPAFESRQPAFERETRPTHQEKESRPSFHERAPRSPPFERRSVSPPFEKETRSSPQEWEVRDRQSHMEARSPVMEKKHRQHHVEHRGSDQPIQRADHQTREKQKTTKAAVSERDSHMMEDRVEKKSTQSTPLRSPPREEQQLVSHKESVKEDRRSTSKTADSGQKEVKQRAKKTEKPREVAASPVPQYQEQAKPQKTKHLQEERKKKGPRTPSPEFRQLPLGLDTEPPIGLGAAHKREKKDSRPKAVPAPVPKGVKPARKEKQVVIQQKVNESLSESSDSDSSSSSGESESEEEESGSGDADEIKVENVRVQHVEREAKKKKEPVAKEPKREQRQDKKVPASRDAHAGHAEATKDRVNDEQKRAVEERKRPPEERKEHVSKNERRDEERYYREHARDHRRTREDEAERRMDGRGSKDMRDPRDSRDHRDYRDFPRVDYRDPRERERFREFDERERHHPFDVRYGPPDFRGGWSRDMRGREGYDAYDGRGIPGDFERHFERDRPHHERGRMPGPWHERRGERPYRESERYHEGRERYQDDGKTSSRTKRSRVSPEPSRTERKGHRKERKRGSGTPPEESEEWDYEEGHSPAPEGKEKQTSSRKRPKQSPVRSPRSDSVKRKKVSTPETSTQNASEKSSDVAEKKEPPAKDDDKDNKKSKKEKDKVKKTKKRITSDDEAATAEEATATPERKRPRETSKDKEVKNLKSEEQTESTKKSDTETEGETSKQKTEAESTKEGETLPTEKKSGEQMFSDWSDGSEGRGSDKPDGVPKAAEEKQEKSRDSKVKNEEETAEDGSFEDVYDPISDDELEAIIADEKQESKAKEKVQPLDIESVDWSVLERKAEKVTEPGDYIKRFSAGNIFSRIGISSTLAGPVLTKMVQERCTQDAPDKEMKDLLLATGQRKLQIGALVAAEARKLKRRASVVSDIGPCRRALCARRDFHIRKQLRKLATSKLGTKLLLENAAVEPVDSGLFAASVSIFRRGMNDAKDESRTQSPTSAPAPSTPSQPETSQVLVC